MSRKGQVWRGEIAERINAYLVGDLDPNALVDWAIDHPFFDDLPTPDDDQRDLDPADQRVIATALGHILQLDPAEHPEGPRASRTTNEQLTSVVDLLWQRPGK